VVPREKILQAKIDLLSKTYLVDYAADIHKDLHGASVPVPEGKPSCLLPLMITIRGY